jgi:rhomboid family protein
MTLQPARNHNSYRPPPHAPLKFYSVTQSLIALNIAIYAIDALTSHKLDPPLAFTINDALRHFQLWRFLTFQFLHAGPGHLFYNMTALYYFGPILEARLQRRPFLVLYLLSGLAGAGLYLLLWRLNLLHVDADQMLVGASAGVFGVMAAAATLEPRRTMTLPLPPVTFRLTTLVLIFLAIALIVVVTSGPNVGGQAAHLGGLAAGFLLARNVPWFKRISAGRTRAQRFWRPGDPNTNFFKEEFRD